MMKPDIIGLAAHENPHIQQWIDAVQRDVEMGLIPSWAGAVVVSVLHDGTTRLILIEKQKWIAAKLCQKMEMN